MTVEKAFHAFCRRQGIKHGGQFSSDVEPAFTAGYTAGTKADLVQTIIDILDGKEWDSETAESIAEVLRAAGHEIRDPRC